MSSIVSEIGADKVEIRLSTFADFMECCNSNSKDYINCMQKNVGGGDFESVKEWV